MLERQSGPKLRLEGGLIAVTDMRGDGGAISWLVGGEGVYRGGVGVKWRDGVGGWR